MSCKWLTVDQMAEVLMVHERTVRRMIKRGHLNAIKIDNTVRVCATIPPEAHIQVPVGQPVEAKRPW